MSKLDEDNTTWQLLFCIQKAEILAYSNQLGKPCKVLHDIKIIVRIETNMITDNSI